MPSEKFEFDAKELAAQFATEQEGWLAEINTSLAEKVKEPEPVIPSGTKSKAAVKVAEPREYHRNLDTGSVRVTSSISDNLKIRRSRDGEVTVKMTATPVGLIPDTPIDVRELVNSPVDAYETLRQIADGYGYRLVHKPGHPLALSNHLVLERVPPIATPGLVVPNSYKIWMPVRKGGLSRFIRLIYSGIYQIVTSIEDRLGEEGEVGEGGLIEIAIPSKPGESVAIQLPPTGSFFSGLATKPKPDSDKALEEWKRRLLRANSGALVSLIKDMELSTNRRLIAVGNLVNRLEEGTADQLRQDSIAIDGATPEGVRWVPKLNWFDPKLSQITDEQLLPLLPDAEREVFMTFLGRGLLGRKGSSIKTPQGYFTQNRKWRLFCIWEGRVAGLGRSTTLEFLSEGFNYLGYSAEAMDDPAGRFSQGKNCALDFGYVDDMDPNRTIGVLSNGTFKTLTSGGRMVVEEKGQPSYSATAQGIYMLCTNQISPERLSELDPGNLSRIAAMRNRTGTCKESKAFAAKYGYPVNVDRGYAHLCDQYGVTNRTLTLLLLSRCADRFAEFAKQSEQEMAMVDALIERRSKFALKIDLDYCSGVLKAYAEVQQWADPSTNGNPGFDIRGFLHMLQHRALSDNKGIEGCKDSTQSLVSYVTDALKYNRGLNKTAEVFFSAIVSEDGFSYPTELSFWSARWADYREAYDWDPMYNKLHPVLIKRSSDLTPEDQEVKKKITAYLSASQKG